MKTRSGQYLQETAEERANRATAWMARMARAVMRVRKAFGPHDPVSKAASNIGWDALRTWTRIQREAFPTATQAAKGLAAVARGFPTTAQVVGGAQLFTRAFEVKP